MDGSAWIEGGDYDRRMAHGGSWFLTPGYLRSAYFYGRTPDGRGYILGIRVGRTILLH